MTSEVTLEMQITLLYLVLHLIYVEKLLGETCNSFDKAIRNWHLGKKKILACFFFKITFAKLVPKETQLDLEFYIFLNSFRLFGDIQTFWCGNFVERHNFCIISGDLTETMWKMCLFTKFPHQKIR